MERLSRWNAELFCTDNFGVYPEVIAADKRCQSQSQTLSPDKGIGLHVSEEKSIGVSKILEVADLAMAFLAKFHIHGRWKDIASLFS